MGVLRLVEGDRTRNQRQPRGRIKVRMLGPLTRLPPPRRQLLLHRHLLLHQLQRQSPLQQQLLSQSPRRRKLVLLRPPLQQRQRQRQMQTPGTRRRRRARARARARAMARAMRGLASAAGRKTLRSAMLRIPPLVMLILFESLVCARRLSQCNEIAISTRTSTQRI